MSRRHYIVVQNTPGYLPESDPIVCTSKRAANACVQELAKELRDDEYPYAGVIIKDAWGLNSVYMYRPEEEHDLEIYIGVDVCDEDECEHLEEL